jgi:hypothetical protein
MMDDIVNKKNKVASRVELKDKESVWCLVDFFRHLI